jgi:hypothetical protein
MKKIIFLCVTVLSLTTVSHNTQAQLLKKFKEKVTGQPTSAVGSNVSAKTEEQYKAILAEDAAKTILETKVTKDELGISGVYYCKDLVVAGEPPVADNLVGKLLFTYTKTNEKAQLSIQSSYSFRDEKPVPAFTITRDGFGFDIEHKRNKATKKPFISGDQNFTGVLAIAGYYEPAVDYEMKDKGKLTFKPFGMTNFALVEPGIMLMSYENKASLHVPKAGLTPEEENQRKRAPIFCFYKKEKEARAKALTQEEMYKMLKEQSIEITKRGDAKLDGYKEFEDKIQEESDKSAANGGGEASSSSSSKEKSGKAPKIKIEFQNKNGSNDIYLEFENNKPNTSTGRVGKGQISSYYFTPGATVKIKGGGVIYTVSADTKNGTRVQL